MIDEDILAGTAKEILTSHTILYQEKDLSIPAAYGTGINK